MANFVVLRDRLFAKVIFSSLRPYSNNTPEQKYWDPKTASEAVAGRGHSLTSARPETGLLMGCAWAAANANAERRHRIGRRLTAAIREQP